MRHRTAVLLMASTDLGGDLRTVGPVATWSGLFGADGYLIDVSLRRDASGCHLAGQALRGEAMAPVRPDRVELRDADAGRALAVDGRGFFRSPVRGPDCRLRIWLGDRLVEVPPIELI